MSQKPPVQCAGPQSTPLSLEKLPLSVAYPMRPAPAAPSPPPLPLIQLEAHVCFCPSQTVTATDPEYAGAVVALEPVD